ncbi:hypothetical protein [Nannocystis pusilla]|uniref:Lipoprotein n=1 Tax=Nannocystis pusilla TaxID=889268 RepID=A0ABS7TR53_9BACT|nr:hypothetical protein [Nannocystis pusilla]MBZ5710709.1 hypothetical protein [Nannocystis pusilla]
MKTTNPLTIRARHPLTLLAALCILAPAVGCDNEPEAGVENGAADLVFADEASASTSKVVGEFVHAGNPDAADPGDDLTEDPSDEGVKVVPLEETEEATSTANSNIVASLQLPEGGEVHFIDLGPPETPGIATIYSGHSATVGALRAHGATPLELFLALAPAEDVPPDALFAHHRRLASEGLAEPSPRSLSLDDLALPPEVTKALSWTGQLSNCSGYSTTATYFSAAKELVEDDFGFELGAHDQEFHSALTSNVSVVLGSSTSGWLASCRKSKGPDNTPNLNQRFDQYSGGVWTTFWDPGFVDQSWGWAFAYSDTVNRNFRMVLQTINDDTAYVAARY